MFEDDVFSLGMNTLVSAELSIVKVALLYEVAKLSYSSL